MKRLFAAAVIIIVILALSIAGYYLNNDLIDTTNELLSQSVSLSNREDKQGLIDAAEKACEYWESKAVPVLSSLIMHSEIDKISYHFKTLLLLAKDGNFEEYRVVCFECIATLEHIKDVQNPVLKNVLHII
ncbi:MAG: DUF4363 family protein [Oscillospiraceae bacterium]|jgi:hypothetical protein|nr:DUF4363 family protein [Oscillospiraceae bacterium]